MNESAEDTLDYYSSKIMESANFFAESVKDKEFEDTNDWLEDLLKQLKNLYEDLYKDTSDTEVNILYEVLESFFK